MSRSERLKLLEHMVAEAKATETAINTFSTVVEVVAARAATRSAEETYNAFTSQEGCAIIRKKVLVVDDNEKNLMLAKDLLEVAGFEVLEADDAANGIAIARKKSQTSSLWMSNSQI